MIAVPAESKAGERTLPAGEGRVDRSFHSGEGPFHFIDWGGEGPLTHLAHATGFCAGVYAPLAERLRPRLRVLGMDDRGHGQTRVPAHPDSLEDWDVFVEDLERFLDHLGRPVVAMGHSRGGVASLLLAVKRPDLVSALVLMDPTILPYSWTLWWSIAKRTGLSRLIPIAARAARRRRLWSSRETLLRVYARREPFTRWEPGFLEGYAIDCTDETEEGGVQLSCDPAWESRCFAVCPHDVWRYVPQIRRPTLVLYGSQSDTFLRPAVKRFRDKAPDASLHCLEDTSHFVPMERPDECARLILSFLEERGVL